MDIRNTRPDPSIPIPIAPAAEAMMAKLPNVHKGQVMVVNGKRLLIQANVLVRSSESRDVSKLTPIYRDHVGRFTTEPVGKESVGVILRGGTNGRLCHVGLFA